MREDRLNNIATVLQQVNEGRETASEIANITGLSPTTCSDILQFLHNNLVGYRFQDFKKVIANIYGKSIELTVITKPLKWNKNLFTKIIDFIKNPTESSFISLKGRALRFFSTIKDNFDKLGGGIKQRFRRWRRNTSQNVVCRLEIMSDRYG